MGHDFGGACISYAMELFPSRISKAIFVAATMLASGQSTLDLFTRQVRLRRNLQLKRSKMRAFALT